MAKERQAFLPRVSYVCSPSYAIHQQGPLSILNNNGDDDNEVMLLKKTFREVVLSSSWQQAALFICRNVHSSDIPCSRMMVSLEGLDYISRLMVVLKR